MVHFIIRTQSISDIITNSSSELFTVKPKNGGITSDVEKIIKEKAEEFRRRDLQKIQDIYDNYYDERTKAEEEGKDVNSLNFRQPWNIIDELGLEHSSGSGGEISVYDIHKQYENRWYPLKHLTYDEYVNLIAKEENTTKEDIEKRILIHIDHSRNATIAWIKENFDVIEEEH